MTFTQVAGCALRASKVQVENCDASALGSHRFCGCFANTACRGCAGDNHYLILEQHFFVSVD
jgi:hypothetical protein